MLNPKPVDIFLHSKRDFVDVIKLRGLEIKRLSWIMWVGPI